MNLLKKEIDSNSWVSGVIAIAIYALMTFGEKFVFNLYGYNTDTDTFTKIIFLLIYETVILALLISIFYKSLKKDFNDLKKNHKLYAPSCLKYWLIGLAISAFLNIIIALVFKTDMSNNEELIRKIFKISPLYMFVSAVIIAPLTEELIFRKSIRNIIKNDLLFLIISGFTFGALHVVSSIESYVDILYILPYSALGIAMAMMMKKTNNIWSSICLHGFHNGIMMSLQFLLLLFGS